MKERVKAYLKEWVSTWRGRWAMRGWRERLSMLATPVVVVISLLVAIWLALWLFFGPPSVEIDDVTVDLDRSVSLAGVDKDANGIRDDIDNYIKVLAEKKAYSAPQVRALEQLAAAAQKVITIDFSNKMSIEVAGNDETSAISCIYERLGENDAHKLVMQVGRLSANSRLRAMAKIKYSHAISGTVITLPKTGKSCTQ